MRTFALAVAFASLALGGCVVPYTYADYEATVVDAETMTPLGGVPVSVEYYTLETLNPPEGARGVSDASGHVSLRLAHWGATYLNVGQTRYFVRTCDVAPRGWVHPDGAEFVQDGPYTFEVESGGGPNAAAIHLQPRGPSDPGIGRDADNCHFAPLFPAP